MAMHMPFDLPDVLHTVDPSLPALLAAEQFLRLIASQHSSTRTPSLITRSTRVWAMTNHDFNISPMVLNVAWSQDAHSTVSIHHRRMHFQEESRSLYTVFKYGDYIHALTEVINGLDCLRAAGVIHTRINPNNVLLSTSSGRVKIADLENARCYDTQLRFEPPPISFSGDATFMAIEYQRRQHFFLKPVWLPDDTLMAQQRDRLGDGTWFQFNFLHDLESVLWMYAWLVFNTLPDCLHADDTAELRKAISAFRVDLFDGGTSERLDFIMRFPESFEKAKDLLIPLYEKADDAVWLPGSLGIFDLLVRWHREVQSTEPVEHEGWMHWDPAHFKQSYYDELREAFMATHEKIKGVGYQAISHGDLEKRALEEQGLAARSSVESIGGASTWDDGEIASTFQDSDTMS